MAEHFKDIQKIQDILHEAQTGLWAIELEEGKEPRMYADKAMLELLGFAGEPSPEECYRGWYERIDPDYYPMVQNGVQRICADERAEVEYLWHHPLWGQIYVRCGGIRDKNFQRGTCLLGYHQNITNTVMLGAFCKATGLVSVDEVAKKVEELWGAKNKEALYKGYEAAVTAEAR